MSTLSFLGEPGATSNLNVYMSMVFDAKALSICALVTDICYGKLSISVTLNWHLSGCIGNDEVKTEILSLVVGKSYPL